MPLVAGGAVAVVVDMAGVGVSGGGGTVGVGDVNVVEGGGMKGRNCEEGG